MTTLLMSLALTFANLSGAFAPTTNEITSAPMSASCCSVGAPCCVPGAPCCK